MARKIVVTSGKGGVGKTTVAVCLAATLARKGQRVLVCDADFGLNNVDVVAGVEQLVAYDIVDVIEGKCRAKQALVRHPLFGNLYFLTSGHASTERYVSPQSVRVVLDALAPIFDFIFIDCPAGLDDGFHRAVASANEAIVVTTPQIAAVRDADRAVTLLKSYHLDNTSIVLNRVRGDMLMSGMGLLPQEIEELLKIPLLGLLPDEYDMSTFDLTEPSKPFKILANNLLTGKKKLYDVTKKYAGFFGNIRRVLKRNL